MQVDKPSRKPRQPDDPSRRRPLPGQGTFTFMSEPWTKADADRDIRARIETFNKFIDALKESIESGIPFNEFDNDDLYPH